MTLYEKHGMINTPEYKVWRGIKDRCLNPNSCNWKRYGERGIKVYEPWIEDFKAFYDYIGPRPSNEYSIDRINNDGHYEPGNVRWATIEEQVYNRCNTLEIELPDGRVVNTKEAMKFLDMKKGTLMSRIYNKTPLDQPLQTHNTQYELDGKLYTISELAKLCSIPQPILQSRLSAGMEIEKAISMPIQYTKRYSYLGQQLTIPEIASIENIADYLIRHHINKDNENYDLYIIIQYLKRNYDDQGNRYDLYRNHGMSDYKKYPEYTAWKNFKSKCYNSNNPDYQYWGAKGITICDDWFYSFPKFYQDNGPRLGPEYSLKVLDKTKPIGPGNTQWQIRDSSFREYECEKIIPLPDGRLVDIHEAMEITGLKRKTIYERVRIGVPLDAKLRGIYIYNDKPHTAEQLSEISGVPLKRLKKRLAKGFDIKKAMTPDLR